MIFSPREVGLIKKIFLSLLQKHSEELHLEHSHLTELPEKYLHKDIKSIHLAYNHFSSIPKNIFWNTRLDALDFSYNRLQEIPDSIQTLHHLLWLNLSHNPLQFLSPFLFKLPQLKYLNVCGVPSETLNQIPHSYSKDLYIEGLYYQERLENSEEWIDAIWKWAEKYRIPEAVWVDMLQIHIGFNRRKEHLMTLKELHIEGLFIAEIPSELAQLPQLERIFISNNPLKDIPCEILYMPSLKEIHAKGLQSIIKHKKRKKNLRIYT